MGKAVENGLKPLLAGDMSNQYELMTLFNDGGFMMYPLVLCSLVALGVMLAKLWTLFIAHRDSKQLLGQIEELTAGGKLSDAIATAETTRGPVAAILLAGLRRVQERQAGGHGSSKDVQKAISTTGIIELDFLERGLAVLGTIANVAPMLGFLGTVIGMILAFQAIEIAGQVDPQLVASGIKVALITTATGLTIAIPVNIGYNYFVTRIDRLIQDMEEGAQKVLDLIWSLESREGYREAS
ncbi:MAG: MotA/TolQ/ExbB proton channel family protein [Gemmatimonadota bacterium]|nr:MotA/TolQ/ExbB proton channel family protein [Gemmatimonadota bacterium]